MLKQNIVKSISMLFFRKYHTCPKTNSAWHWQVGNVAEPETENLQRRHFVFIYGVHVDLSEFFRSQI